MLKAGAPDFVPTGKGPFVYPTGLLAGTKPISRDYFDKVAKAQSRGSHFYTSADAERAALNSLNPGNVEAPQDRAFRGARFPDDPSHRFTTDLTLHNSLVTAGWDGEGVKMRVSP